MERAGWIQAHAPADPASVAAVHEPEGPACCAVDDPWGVAASLRGDGPSVRIVDAHGCQDGADRVLCLGRALGCVPPGEPSRVAAALAEDAPERIVLVGTSLPVAGERSRLEALAPAAAWTHLSWRTEGPAGDETDPAWTALAALPRGLPAMLGSGDDATRPSDPGRIALVQPRPQPGDAPLAAVLVAELLHGALRLAEDAPLPQTTTLSDLFALRWLAAHHPSADMAARAAAATARVRLCWGQPAVAHATLRAATLRAAPASESARARLDQAEGDILAHLGDAAAAAAAYDRAAARLRGARDLPLLLRFTRRRAEHLLARGRPDAARPHLRTARALSRELADPLAGAAALRASGDAAAAAGESLGAEALYDQAASTPVPSGERANRLLGEISLALRRGELEQAGVLLSRLPPDATGLTRAGALHRAAEHALHTGNVERAVRTASQAAQAFARAGALAGQARATRLSGDAHAAAGRSQAALGCYADALEVQVRGHDLAGARRTLDHAARVCDAGGATEPAARLRALARDV
jgi:tetratricopeptide (TPR) repeat protein